MEVSDGIGLGGRGDLARLMFNILFCNVLFCTAWLRLKRRGDSEGWGRGGFGIRTVCCGVS